MSSDIPILDYISNKCIKDKEKFEHNQKRLLKVKSILSDYVSIIESYYIGNHGYYSVDFYWELPNNKHIELLTKLRQCGFEADLNAVFGNKSNIQFSDPLFKECKSNV